MSRAKRKRRGRVHTGTRPGTRPAHLHFDVRFLVQALDPKFRVSDESDALARVPADPVDAFTRR